MRVEGIVQVNVPIISKGTSEGKVFSGMQQGDMVNAKVLDVSGNEVILKTQDGSIIKAEFAADGTVKAGDNLQLMLTAQGDKNVALKLVAVNNAPIGLNVNNMEASLLRMGVEPSAANIRLAQILQNDGFLPTAKNIANLGKIATQFPDLDGKLATFMAANDIAPTEKNINALMQIIQNPKAFSNDLQMLTQFAKESLNLNLANSAGNAKVFTNAFVSTLFSNAKGAGLPTEIVSSPNFTSFMDSLSGMSLEEGKTAIKNFVNNSNIPAKQEAIALLTAAFTQAKEVSEPTTTTNPQNTASPKQEGQISQNTQTTQNAPTQTNTETPQIKEQAQPTAQNTTDAKASVNAGADKGSVSIAQKADANGQTAQPKVVENSTAPIKSQASSTPLDAKNVNTTPTVASSIPQNSDTPLTAAVKLLGAINKLFAPLQSEGVANPIHESIKNQLDLLSNIKGNAAKIGTEAGTTATARADNVLAQAVVANTFDNFYYCQIPFEYKNQKNSAELFVFEKNKGSDLNDKTNVTVLIALETQNMGRIETVMRSMDKDLNLELRVDNDKIKNYMEKSAQELKESLKEVSFDVKSIEVKIIEEATTPLNAQKILNEEQRVVLSGIDIQV